MDALVRNILIASLLFFAGEARLEAASSASLADQAWQITGLIVSDDHARSAARHRVVNAMLDRGDLPGALERATMLDGWRKLAAYGRIGELAYRAGNTNDTVRYGREIEYQLPGLSGWEYTHVLAACLRVKALAGDRDYLASVMNLYAGNDKITGMAGAADVFVRARSGDLEDGLSALAAIAAKGDYDVVIECVQFGRLLVDGQTDRLLPAPMIVSAVQLIQGVPGNRKIELLIDLLEDVGSRMMPASRTELVQAVKDELGGGTYPTHIEGPLWASLAVACAPLEELRQSADDALSAARPLITGMMLFEQPPVKARIAEAEARLGRLDVARAMLQDAYVEAEALVNARPRYAAMTEVTLAAYRAGLDDAIPALGAGQQ